MGLSLFSSSSHDRPAVSSAPDPLPNPNPRRYTIVKQEEWNGFVVVKVFHPDCKNYEGMKILVFASEPFDRAMRMGILDPHFSDKGPSPIARFEPTKRGWMLALSLASIMGAAK